VDVFELNGCFGWGERLALVRGPVVIARLAVLGDVLALVAHDLAALVAGGQGGLVAFVGLGPALLVGFPAPGLLGVGGYFFAAPVVVFDDAAFGFETLGLLGLRLGVALGAR
jgi:hypothetical protein